MPFPEWRVANGAGCYSDLYPTVVDFPPLRLTRIDDVDCLPHAPPLLTARRLLISDYLIPWDPGVLAWFDYLGDGRYRAQASIPEADVEHEIGTGFYMEHSICQHYGHFVADCLNRMYAWDAAQALFPDVKIVLSAGRGTKFQNYYLGALGVRESQVVRMRGLVRCKRLLMATPCFATELYSTPASTRFWRRLRDSCVDPRVTSPDRIYLSRRNVFSRKLANEDAVEQLFASHGFKIIQPEDLGVADQLNLIANASLIAGPGGSAMLNLAFQGRMRSAFVLRPEFLTHRLELLISAGQGADIWYHIGQRVPAADGRPADTWVVDIRTLTRNVRDWLAHAGGDVSN